MTRRRILIAVASLVGLVLAAISSFFAFTDPPVEPFDPVAWDPHLR